MAVKRTSAKPETNQVFGHARKPEKMLRAALYARVSTLDQQTLPMQMRAMREYAANRGWAVALQVKEVGSGAKAREQRQQLIDAGRRREIDIVLVWRLDRWGRSLLDLVTTLQELIDLNIGFVSISEALDLTTSTGRAMAGMLSVFAAFEHDILRDRVRAGLDHARQSGPRLGRPATATVKAAEVRKLFRQGISKSEISRRLDIGRTSVRRILAQKKSAIASLYARPPKTHKLRQAEGSCSVRWKREEGKQNVGFSSRPFVLCGLPVRKPRQGEMLYERRNGNFTLQITGHPHYGLPFGQDRIVPIYLATLAVRQQSQTIRFRTAAEMLETFGMHKGGKEYRRLIAAFERIFGATIFFGTDTLSGKAKVVQRSRFNFFTEAQIWYSRDPNQCPLSDQFENVIVLSDEFYREIMSHPIPADLEAVKVLAGAPAVLDLFMWLSYRCFVAKGREAIPLVGPFGLATQIGSIEYARPRRFREKLEEWLNSIHVLWPECPAQISSDGLALIVEQAHAVRPTKHLPITVNSQAAIPMRSESSHA